MHSNIKMRPLFDINFIVPPGKSNLVSWVVLVLDSEVLALESYLFEVLGSAHIDSLETLDEVLKAHPEGAVVVV